MMYIIAAIGAAITFILGLFFRQGVDNQKQINKLAQLKDKYDEIDSQDDTRSDIDVLRQHKPK